jgi:hypothetical protein
MKLSEQAAWLAVLAIAAAGCRSGAGTAGDAGSDERASDAGAADASPFYCTRSVASACADLNGRNACPATWEAAQADRTGCDFFYSLLLLDCGRYFGFARVVVDTALTYFYDKTDGTLVAVVPVGNVEPGCLGGPFDVDFTELANWVNNKSCTIVRTSRGCDAGAD